MYEVYGYVCTSEARKDVYRICVFSKTVVFYCDSGCKGAFETVFPQPLIQNGPEMRIQMLSSGRLCIAHACFSTDGSKQEEEGRCVAAPVAAAGNDIWF